MFQPTKYHLSPRLQLVDCRWCPAHPPKKWVVKLIQLALDHLIGENSKKLFAETPLHAVTTDPAWPTIKPFSARTRTYSEGHRRKADEMDLSLRLRQNWQNDTNKTYFGFWSRPLSLQNAYASTKSLFVQSMLSPVMLESLWQLVHVKTAWNAQAVEVPGTLAVSSSLASDSSDFEVPCQHVVEARLRLQKLLATSKNLRQPTRPPKTFAWQNDLNMGRWVFLVAAPSFDWGFALRTLKLQNSALLGRSQSAWPPHKEIMDQNPAGPKSIFPEFFKLKLLLFQTDYWVLLGCQDS